MASISIFVGSMYGNAESLSVEVQKALVDKGHNAQVHENAMVSDINAAENILFISSTTGTGDIPDNLQPLIMQMQSQFPMLTGKKVGVIALGDSSYGDTYCGAGKQIDELIQELNAQTPLPRLEIDAGEHFEPWEPTQSWLNRWSAAL